MDSAIGQQLFVLLVGAMLAVPGIVALYVGLRRNDEERNRQLQVGALSDEVLRLQRLVDDQQRKLNEMNLDVANLRATQKMLVENMKRLAQQVKKRGEEPVVDVDALMEMLG